MERKSAQPTFADVAIADLGGPQFSPQGGPLFNTFAAVFGWRLARRVQRLVRHIKPPMRNVP